MLPRDTLSLPPVLRTTAASALETVGDPRQQAFQRALAVHLGKSMQGEVLAKLTDGSFVVRVADTAARMQLPPGAQVGGQVPMTLVALHPRATFQVGPGAFAEAGPPLPADADPATAPLAYHQRGAAHSAAAQSLSRAAALLASARFGTSSEAEAAAPGDGAELSATGKALGSVLAAAMKGEQSATAVIARTPVMPSPTTNSAAMAPALQQAIARSGLFYESHVAEWAQGRRTLADLSGEPQMGPQRPGAMTDPATAQFINLQLATHEQALLAWQGQLWPGQQMQWEIEKDAPERDNGGEGDEAGWQSRLRLRFPMLGELAARIALAGEHVQIRIDARDEAAGELLRAHADRLTDALEAGGTPVSLLSIGTAKARDD